MEETKFLVDTHYLGTPKAYREVTINEVRSFLVDYWEGEEDDWDSEVRTLDEYIALIWEADWDTLDEMLAPLEYLIEDTEEDAKGIHFAK